MTRARRKTKRKSTPNSTLLIVGAAVVIALVGVVIWATQPKPANTPNALGFCGSTTCGQSSAPVTVDIYSDFQ